MDNKSNIILKFKNQTNNQKSESLSSLPLQISISCHIALYLPLLTSQIICFILKFKYLSSIYCDILIAIFIVHYGIEIIRLYLAYAGNKEENIPNLSGAWITGLILQLPVSCFLLFNSDIIPLPLEIFTQSIHFTLLLVEVITGFFTIHTMADHQVKVFKNKILMDDNKKDN
uniref:Transmembrane protein 17B n=1 Tax=Strongyloides papillosus TaxID=174720 RepID=A0A0N5C3G4_STREA